MRVKNKLTLIDEYFDYDNPLCYETKPDKLFITAMIIKEVDNSLNPYIFITTTETGIDITKNLFDLVLINDGDDTDVISIYDLPNTFCKKIPINYDFTLFFRDVSNYVSFNHYPVRQNPIIVESIFNKLININISNDSYNLKLGDIFCCIPNPNYVTENTDILWSVFNSFNNELLYTSKDYMLKYRITEKTIYTIQLEFKINNVPYIIRKNSIQSTFNYEE